VSFWEKAVSGKDPIKWDRLLELVEIKDKQIKELDEAKTTAFALLRNCQGRDLPNIERIASWAHADTSYFPADLALPD
jgi:hypothetical protein